MAACHEIADLDARHHLERSASNACDPRSRFRPPGHDRAAEYQAVLAFTPTNRHASSTCSFSVIWSDFLPESSYASEWRPSIGCLAFLLKNHADPYLTPSRADYDCFVNISG
jgi:hypothetical protein